MQLKMEHASCGYGGKAVVRDVNLAVDQGEIVCLLGPNGIGKTTIFRSFLGLLSLVEGSVTLDGVTREKLGNREFARRVGYVPQGHDMPFAYAVPDVIVMGRTARLGSFRSPGVREYLIADKVMDMLGIAKLRDKTYNQLSGGERQMVLVARAVAQEPKILLLDEPTASLDFGNQITVMECIRRLADAGMGVFMTTHNPDQAFLCADRAVLVTKDRCILEGPVDQIVTEKNMREAYDVDVRIAETVIEDGTVMRSCVPLLRHNVFPDIIAMRP